MGYRLSFITTLSTYILIILGVLVVGLDAGLACSDWPLCNGRIVPPLEGIILVEFTHRTFSALTGLLIVWNAVSLWRKHPHDRLMRKLSALSVLLLGLVGVMGGINVLNKLPSGLTAVDMAFAVLLLAVLAILTVRVKAKAETERMASSNSDAEWERSLERLRKPAFFTAGAIYFEILAGGFLKHSSASYTYVHPEAPLPGELITSYPVAEAVMNLHMLAAFSVVLALFWLFVYTRKKKLFFGQTISIMVLTGLQVFLGFFSLVTKLELLTATAHMAVASMMLWIGVYIAAGVTFKCAKPVAPRRGETGIPRGRTVATNG